MALHARRAVAEQQDGFSGGGKPARHHGDTSGLTAFGLYARITSSPFTAGAAAGSAMIMTPAISTPSNESSV